MKNKKLTWGNIIVSIFQKNDSGWVNEVEIYGENAGQLAKYKFIKYNIDNEAILSPHTGGNYIQSADVVRALIDDLTITRISAYQPRNTDSPNLVNYKIYVK